MKKAIIFCYINLVLKIIIMIVLLTSGNFYYLFQYFFEVKYLYTIGILITQGIYGIILITACILWFIIIKLKRTNNYSKFKRYYRINLIAEIIAIFLFINEPISATAGPHKYWEVVYEFLFYIIISTIALIMGLIYFFKKRKVLQSKITYEGFEKFKTTDENFEKLKDILSVSDRIKLERVQNILNLDDKIFNEKIIEWAKEFGFRIDGEYLVTQKETVDAFIYALEKQFLEWEKKEKAKDGKL